VIGWREWLALPAFGIAGIKVKVDSGARSSTLHAFGLGSEERLPGQRVRFQLHPLQRDTSQTVTVEAEVIDERWVRSSSGKATLRPVIRSQAVLGGWRFPLEITLVRRDLMGFRMLLGRQAIRRRFLVDPGRSFLAGEPRPWEARRLPRQRRARPTDPAEKNR